MKSITSYMLGLFSAAIIIIGCGVAVNTNQSTNPNPVTGIEQNKVYSLGSDGNVQIVGVVFNGKTCVTSVVVKSSYDNMTDNAVSTSTSCVE